MELKIDDVVLNLLPDSVIVWPVHRLDWAKTVQMRIVYEIDAATGLDVDTVYASRRIILSNKAQIVFCTPSNFNHLRGVWVDHVVPDQYLGDNYEANSKFWDFIETRMRPKGEE